MDLTFEKWKENVEKSNELFANATPAEKIVMVAKDVLQLCSLKYLIPKTGNYVLIGLPADLKGGDSYREKPLPEEMSTLLKEVELPYCQVCAIGGAMVATTIRLNKVPLNSSQSPCCLDDDELYVGYSGVRSSGMSERAREVFPKELLSEMERAFETGDYGYGDAGKAAQRFEAIYQNLVENQGKKFTAYADWSNDYSIFFKAGQTVWHEEMKHAET